MLDVPAVGEIQADRNQASQSDRIGAVFHLRGIAKLLHLCGPQAFQQQPLLYAFEAARAILVVSSLIGKQRLFLEAEPWLTVPWLKNPALKTPQSELLDILILVPGILQVHAASTCSQPNLLQRVNSQLTRLYQWRWNWQATPFRDVRTELETSTLSVPGIGRTSRLRFGRFVLASELMLYNATLMWLIALLFKIDPMGAAGHITACATSAMPQEADARLQSFLPLRRPGASLSLRDPALEICRAFEWVTRNHDHSRGTPTYLYLFPVGMAMTALQDDPESMVWIKTMLEASPSTANYGLGANQTGFGFYLSREALSEPGMPKTEGSLFSDDDMRRLSVLNIY